MVNGEAVRLLVPVGNGGIVAVLVIELLRELVGENVPLNDKSESVRLVDNVKNAEDRVFEINADMEFD